MHPTVGRIVHFYRANEYQPSAAIITTVHSDTIVSLCVFDHGSNPRAMTSIQLAEGAAPFDAACWAWPPRVP